MGTVGFSSNNVHDEAVECLYTEGANSDDSSSDLELRVTTRNYARRRQCYCSPKLLLASFIICIILLVASMVTNIAQYLYLAHNPQSCQDATCVEVAGTTLAAMNVKVDPCQDFYEYSCGNWLQTTIPPPSSPKWSSFSEVAKRNEALVKQLLDKPGNTYLNQNSTAVHKAKQYYKACMNRSSINHLGNTPMLQLIKELGSWHVTPDSMGKMADEDWNLQSSLVKAFFYGSPLFGMGMDIDSKNSSRYVIFFDQDGILYHDRDFYVGNASEVEKYKKAEVDMFVEVAQALGAADEEATRAMAEDVWFFERSLAKIFVPHDERIDPTSTYNPMTLADLQTLVGNWIDLKSYLQEIFKTNIEDSHIVMAYGKPYLSQLQAVVLATNDDTLANYLVWNVISGWLTYMTQPFLDAVLHWKHVVYGVDALPERWKSCVSHTDSNFPYVTGGLFVQEKFSEDDKQKAINILNGVREEFMRRLPDVPWMDEMSQKNASIKATHVNPKIGYPDLIMHVDKLDEKYDKLKMTDSFFQNALNSAKFNTEEQLSHLGKRVDKTEWEMSAMEVNAYYHPNYNQMVFPAGILQWPFYSPKFSMAMNFGGLGSVMGHELTHGFDNQGRHFDLNGNMVDWWTNRSVEQFHEHGQCIVQQYSKYKVVDENLDGERTLGENIADNGGLKSSFQAYENWLAQNGNHERAAILPGLELTERQLFFVGYAQTWCTYETDAYAKQSLHTDVHSYFKYRVLGTLSNMQEFADAYKCPVNSPMNPEHKCVIW